MPVLIGTSGWQYRDWRGTFYPAGLPQAKWLEYYAERFQTQEVNNAFYRLPEASTFTAWAERTPDDFVMVVKASRFLTHIKRLKDPEEPCKPAKENRWNGLVTRHSAHRPRRCLVILNDGRAETVITGDPHLTELPDNKGPRATGDLVAQGVSDEPTIQWLFAAIEADRDVLGCQLLRLAVTHGSVASIGTSQLGAPSAPST